uniref:WD repeat and FYVE domain containing 1 n=1 Tax=Mastacembelus armatus TaxID=205130 RepID=A0A7N8WWA2_9TELE
MLIHFHQVKLFKHFVNTFFYPTPFIGFYEQNQAFCAKGIRAATCSLGDYCVCNILTFSFRTIRVWLKRDSGQYWPSIYHTVSSPCSCMSYHHDSRRIFIGQDNGAVVVSEFLISEDFNKMNHVKTYPAHQNRVSDMIFSLESEWVVSTGHDKSVSWMCTQSGSMLGRHYFTAWASCLQYDHETQHAFVGDYSGQITLLKLEKQTYSTITTLKGHEGSVGALWWDPIQRLLFSGASDHSVIMWDIGGRKGRTLLLQGHHERVQALRYLQLTRQLVTCSADGGIAVWNMDTQREEAPQWLDSDSCQKCEQPFFWNIKQMWDTKTLGLRQHHCRKCGKAVCGKCSSKRSTFPVMGFEFPVRICDACFETIKEEDRTPLATFHEGKHNIAHMDMDPSRGLMVTCGSDRIVKVNNSPLIPDNLCVFRPCQTNLLKQIQLVMLELHSGHEIGISTILNSKHYKNRNWFSQFMDHV